MGFFNSKRSGTGYLDYIISFTDFGYLVQIQDITKRKHVEEVMKEKEEKFTKIFHANPAAIALLKHEGPIIEVNDQFTKLTEFSREEIIGRSSVDLNLVNAEFREKIQEEMQRKGSIYNLELEIQTKFRGKRTVLNTIENIEINGENRRLSIFIDITDRKKAEKALKEAHDNLELKVQERTTELNALIEELKRSNKELQQFAYVTSHDLQEPLRTIASFTQLLERRYKNKLDSDADEFIDYIVEASIRMKQMIQDLLEYSRIGTQGKGFQPVDIEELLKHALANLNNLIEKNHAEITHDNLPTVLADKGQLLKLFQNLINNAIKFKKENKNPKIHISTFKDVEKDEYVFKVTDNGIGMESQYAERIFTIFQRLHTRDEYDGTGIGLAISKRVVEHHEGHIWVESKFGKGSTFYFTIPIRMFK